MIQSFPSFLEDYISQISALQPRSNQVWRLPAPAHAEGRGKSWFGFGVGRGRAV